jgi:hypothetical protein
MRCVNGVARSYEVTCELTKFDAIFRRSAVTGEKGFAIAQQDQRRDQMRRVISTIDRRPLGTRGGNRASIR